MTEIANYSLLSMRPDPERIDMLCIGAVVYTHREGWNVFTPGIDKLNALGYSGAARKLLAMSSNLQTLLADCNTIGDARAMLSLMRSTLSLHEFEGVFAYESDNDFGRHIRAITLESIVIPQISETRPTPPRVGRTQVRAKLRRHFAEMGILAPTGNTDADHKVVTNYPLSEKLGLKAEFALKNSVWHITETVDFEVSTEGVRNKTYEAQAKCLVLKAAKDILGDQTKRYIVVHGSQAEHASSSVDLLSTTGRLFMTESSEDMTEYLDLMAKAAGGSLQVRA